MKVITRIHLKVKDGKIIVLREARPEFEIVTDFKTIARLLMGCRKVDGELYGFDVWDAWLNGDIKVYGKGHAPRVIAMLQKVFGDKELTRQIREKYGKILEVFI